jgi:hypothetical protein
MGELYYSNDLEFQAQRKLELPKENVHSVVSIELPSRLGIRIPWRIQSYVRKNFKM